MKFLSTAMLEDRATNQLVTRPPLPLINQLDTRLLLSPQPQHMVRHLGTRPQLHPIQAINRLTAAQAVIHQRLPLSIRDTVSSPRVVATHRPVADQVISSHRDTSKVEDTSLVARGVMVAAKTAAEVTRVVGIKVIVDMVVVVVPVVDMGSRALPMGKVAVAMEAVAEEGRLRFSLSLLFVAILYYMQ